MTKQEHKDYCDFMWNNKNAYCCSKCPENRGDDRRRYPCGQQNCWVVCHTKADKSTDE